MALLLGASIGAGLLVIDSIWQIPLLTPLGLQYGATIVIGLIAGVALIILTDNDWFEDLVGIRNIEVLPNVCRWTSYSLFALSLLMLVSDLSPLIAEATGLPINSISVAASTFLLGLVALIKEALKL